MSWLASACTVGPDYVKPAAPKSDRWRQQIEGRLSSDAPDLARWWDAFGDPTLVALVESVERENRSLRAAMHRISAARATAAGVDAELFPRLGASGRLEWFRNSGNGQLGQFPGAGPDDEELARIGLEASWEIDVFGRIRRASEAAAADLEATIEDWHDLLVVLRAEVALAYVDHRSLQERLAIARANAELQTRTLDLARGRFETGLAPELDVAQAQQNLASTEAVIPTLEQAVRATSNRIAVLLGVPPLAAERLVETAAPVPALPQQLEVGVPAELLRRRPDLRAAERRVAADIARVGVATAELYPSFSLTGFLGYESLTFDETLTARSRTYTAGPSFRWRLFEFGRIRAEIDAREAIADASLADYEQAVLNAMAEVEDTLTGVVAEERRLRSLDAALDASRRAAELVRTLYLEGLTDFQNVLDAERTLRTVEDQQAVSRADLARLAIRLYRVLGGGVPQRRDATEERP